MRCELKLVGQWIWREMEYRIPPLPGLHVTSVRISENDEHCCVIIPDPADFRPEHEDQNWHCFIPKADKNGNPL